MAPQSKLLLDSSPGTASGETQGLSQSGVVRGLGGGALWGAGISKASFSSFARTLLSTRAGTVHLLRVQHSQAERTPSPEATTQP